MRDKKILIVEKEKDAVNNQPQSGVWFEVRAGSPRDTDTFTVKERIIHVKERIAQEGNGPITRAQVAVNLDLEEECIINGEARVGRIDVMMLGPEGQPLGLLNPYKPPFFRAVATALIGSPKDIRYDRMLSSIQMLERYANDARYLENGQTNGLTENGAHST